MKLFKVFVLMAVFLMCINTAFAQKAKLKEADKLYEQLAFRPAINVYKEVLGKQPDNATAITRIAHSYRLVNDMDSAEVWYAKVVALPETDTMSYFYYARALHTNDKYDEARNWYEKFLTLKPGDERALMGIEATEKMPALKEQPPKYAVFNLPINTARSEFGPSFYDKGIAFASDRNEGENTGKTFAWTGAPFLNIWFTNRDSMEFTPPAQFKGSVNTKYHDGPVAFTSGNDTMFFTRSFYEPGTFGGSLKKNEENIVLLKIMYAAYDSSKKEWKDAKEMPFNNKEYSVSDPFLTRDGKALYFASDMPGGSGGLDIYVSRRDGDSWSEPKNLGSNINTAGDERTPFLAEDSTFYFASNTHPGMGGLDVFRSAYDPGDQSYGEVVNLGKPVNSSRDDFGFIIDRDNLTGYFSSDRRTGKGSDDIYSYNFLKLRLEGIVVEANTRDTLEEAEVILINKRTNEETVVKTKDDGSFSFELDAETEYVVKGNISKYSDGADSFDTYGVTKPMIIRKILELERLGIGVTVDLYNIYFDFDRSNIREDASTDLDTLYNILSDNPDLDVEIGAHTDSRGSDRYNERLSQRRAQAVVDYLIKKGIETGRLTAKGYGEYRLTNECSDGVPCTEVQHQRNRRAHFTVLGNNDTLRSKERFTEKADYRVPGGKYPESNYKTPEVRRQERNTRESLQIPVIKPQDTRRDRSDIGDVEYKIQFTAVATQKEFKGLSKLGNIEMEENGNIYRYLIGSFSSEKDATQVLEKLKGEGFNTAFVVKYVNGHRS